MSPIIRKPPGILMQLNPISIYYIGWLKFKLGNTEKIVKNEMFIEHRFLIGPCIQYGLHTWYECGALALLGIHHQYLTNKNVDVLPKL